jgi:hypothetical protein
VLGPLGEDQAHRLTRAARGVALVLDPDGPEVADRGPDGSRGASRTARLLAAGGWRAVDVTPGARLETLWTELVAGGGTA